MLQQYTRAELETTNRTQLWSLCRERGLKCHPASADCVEAIWNKQQSVEKVAPIVFPISPCKSLLLDVPRRTTEPDEQAVSEVAATEQPKSCATCPLFQPFNDGTGRGLCCGVADTSLVVRDHHQQTQDCLNLIDEQKVSETVEPDLSATVHSGSLTFKKTSSPNPTKTVYEVFRGLDSLGIIIKNETGTWSSSGDALIYATPYEAAAALLKPTTSLDLPTDEAPEIEVDSDVDADFGTLYRVWYNRHLLGTFYRATDGNWIAQPCNTVHRPIFSSAAEAQLLIVATSGLLVADTSEEVEAVDLLDKPFDELTVADWQALKQQALQAEFVAA